EGRGKPDSPVLRGERDFPELQVPVEPVFGQRIRGIAAVSAGPPGGPGIDRLLQGCQLDRQLNLDPGRRRPDAGWRGMPDHGCRNVQLVRLEDEVEDHAGSDKQGQQDDGRSSAHDPSPIATWRLERRASSEPAQTPFFLATPSLASILTSPESWPPEPASLRPAPASNGPDRQADGRCCACARRAAAAPPRPLADAAA